MTALCSLLAAMDGKTPALPWLPPSTPSTWVCMCGAVNPATNTRCWSCS